METRQEGIASRATRKGMSLLSALLIIVLVIAGAVSLRTYVFQVYYIPSGSMSSTLEVDDKVVGWKLFKDIDRGDVVVFEDPGGWLEGYDEDDNKIVKRVIGLPGDTVKCCSSDGNLVVNGTELTETYLDNTVTPSEEPFTVTVDEDQLWVMGGTRSVKGALQILWQQHELGDDGARPIIDYSNRDTDLRVLTSTARYIAAYIVRDKIRDEGAVRKPTVADIENEVPLAGRSVIGFGMYDGGGRMDASAVIEGGVITWGSFGKDWPDDIRETYIARHLFRFLDSYSWTARTGGELVNYIQDGWDEPGPNSTIYASYGNPRAVDGA